MDEYILKKKYTLLVVDDNPSNLQHAVWVLGERYKIIPVKSGAEALAALLKVKVDLILLDIEMTEMNGYETFEKIKQDQRIKDIPVVFLTAHSNIENEIKSFSMGAVDYITKPFRPEIVFARLASQLELAEYRNNLETLVKNKTKEIEMLSMQSIMAISNAVDKKDLYTRQHSARVAKYSREIAARLKWSSEDIDNLYNMALLHDIGKIGIPDSILKKPGRLTDEEFAVMKTHTVMGAEILKDITVIKDVVLGAKYHHERYDGRGYMQGLKGEEIPIVARVVGMADAYDAMTSDRAYRRKLPEDVVRNEIIRCRGSQFDPVMVDVMLTIMDDGLDFPDEE